jgi:hypothetical protein
MGFDGTDLPGRIDRAGEVKKKMTIDDWEIDDWKSQASFARPPREEHPGLLKQGQLQVSPLRRYAPSVEMTSG